MMKFYRVRYTNMPDSSLGYSWHTSTKGAAAAAKEFLAKHEPDDLAEARIDTVEVVPTKRGILDALQAYASHNDNG